MTNDNVMPFPRPIAADAAKKRAQSLPEDSEVCEEAAAEQQKEASSNLDMLTPAKIESLRQEAKETRAYYQRLFAYLRPKKGKPHE